LSADAVSPLLDQPGAGLPAVELLLSRMIIAEFEAQVPRWPALRTRCRHTHPWFGPLDAHGWLCLAGMHHVIHRRQLERILQAS
jgi:hypothetical protein